MKKTVILVGSMLLVVAALYFTVNSVLAGKGGSKKSNFVSYDTLEERIEEIVDERLSDSLEPQVSSLVDDSLDEFRDEIVAANNRMTSIQQTLDSINSRLDIMEAEIN